MPTPPSPPRPRGRPPRVSPTPQQTREALIRGGTELLTLFWTNEVFDPSDPDTFPEPVVVAA